MVNVISKIFSGLGWKKKQDYPHLKGDALSRAISKAQKDPEFMKEVKEFVKVTTN